MMNPSTVSFADRSLRAIVFAVIVLAPIALAVYLFIAWTAPTGQREVSYKPGRASAFVQRPLPDERLSPVQQDERGAFIALTDEPVYFSVTPPSGAFTEATVEVAFAPQGTPVLELGGLRDVASQSFDFRPLSNLLLEQLPWTRHSLEDGLVLFSTEGLPAEEFFLSPPARSEVATYRAVFLAPYREPGYTPCATQICHTWNVALRGPHEALTYIKNEQFLLNVTYADLNRTFGADEGFVKVFNETGEEMKVTTFADDNNSSADQRQTVKTVSVVGEGWSEGVYRIAFSGTSDIAWRSLATHQRYLVFKNTLYIGDDVGFFAEPRTTHFFTNAKRLVFETAHAEGLQTLRLADQDLVIAETHEKYSYLVPTPGVLHGISPVGDMKITGEGKYALSADAYFDPDPASITAFSDIVSLGVEYVYAHLPESVERDGWRIASSTFLLSELVQEGGAYKFALSAPGLTTFETAPEIHRITVRFNGESPTVRQMLANIWHRLKNGVKQKYE